jgi:hypothetical protein
MKEWIKSHIGASIVIGLMLLAIVGGVSNAIGERMRAAEIAAEEAEREADEAEPERPDLEVNEGPSPEPFCERYPDSFSCKDGGLGGGEPATHCEAYPSSPRCAPGGSLADEPETFEPTAADVVNFMEATDPQTIEDFRESYAALGEAGFPAFAEGYGNPPDSPSAREVWNELVRRYG